MPNTHFKSQIYRISSFLLYNIFICLTACLMACHKTWFIYAPVFHVTKVIMLDLQNCCSKERLYPLRHGASFYPLLVSFHIQVTYIKVRILQIGVNKLVEKVWINLLHHVDYC